jgi:uncharacterized protein YhbP (UPF0306 family)
VAASLADEVRTIVDGNLYLVLGTADETGRPWATPVYFAHVDYREFFWVSRPTARHSRNIERRSAVGIVIFDSQVPINSGKAVYVEADAHEVDPDARANALAVYSRRAIAHGGTAFTAGDVTGEAALRLYRATASALYVLDERDQRVSVALGA